MVRSIVKSDRLRGMLKSLETLTGEQLVVGIPRDSAARTDGDITNAELGYIHENGAPGANIPARPFLVPGVRRATKDMLVHLKKACNFALDEDYAKAHKEMVAAGLIAERSIKRELMTGIFAPLKPSTIANRYRQRGVKGPSERERRYMRLVEAGASAQAAQDATGIRPLLNTRQLYEAIHSVVRKVPAVRWADRVIRAVTNAAKSAKV